MKLLERFSRFEGIWLEDQTSEAYHADKTAVSSSPLRKILKSPASFYSYFTEAAHEETDAFRFGSAVHMAILEPKKFFDSYIREPDFGDLRSPTNRTKKAEWKTTLPAHAVVLNLKEHIQLEGMVNSVLRHRDASALLKHGKAELSGYYCDPETGIKCKIKPDFINFELMTVVDVKTTMDSSLDSFSKSIWKWRYDIQAQMYCEGTQLITGRQVNHFVFLAIEKEPPFEVCLYVADEGILGKGQEDYRRALDLLSDCLHKNHWPPMQESLQPIHLPFWAFNQS